MLAPKPTDPCTAAPMVIAASAITYSAPDRWMARLLDRAAELR
jgi:hypothetical protein